MQPDTDDQSLRKRALYAATYHHDGVLDRAAVGNGRIRIEMHANQLDETHEYVTTMAKALGYSVSMEGRFVLVARPE